MKKEIRIIGIDDSPFDKHRDRTLLVVGAVFRGGSALDGVLSTRVVVDGNDSTEKLIRMINGCKYKPQLKCILLNGIAFGGFNIIDIQELNRRAAIPVIVVIRRKPGIANIRRILKRIGKAAEATLLDKAGTLSKVRNIYIQTAGISRQQAKEILDLTCTRADIPEPLRIAHIIASGIVKGESRGKA